ncbi:FliM/FliN family flagellar motor C-terminal domain-containing protein [Sandaracinobacteroides saxicola]|uniref:FliM/FliN family flagellar motor switch protein n=1 Tax=Sandaracinobacteroides saxicola TaxID=2759707 RepID=A0A7G5IK07_9SPHN|nr:FliM/FliN family flagellar motor C-terminal domain-containing protein [Sandaracinobacteroides saxicola]QMW23699.1 FliM/FliN family flagellar motor switch protein [Sandaracinobacteroides saxicola]
MQGLFAAEASVEIDLDPCILTLGAIRNLGRGAVIPISRSAADQVTLRVNGEPVARATISMTDRALHLRLGAI